MPTPYALTVLYTVGLRGRINALPRLFTLMQRERFAAAGVVIAFDLGESCIRGNLLCEATGGRALLVALDALGCEAFYLDQADPLSSDPDILAKLRAVIVTPMVSDERLAPPLLLTKRARGGEVLSLRVAGWDTALPAALGEVLTIRLARRMPDPDIVRYDSEKQTLWLTDQLTGQADSADAVRLGQIRLVSDTTGVTVRHAYLTVTAEVPPDPTVSGVIDFVLGEARYASRRTGQ